MNTTPQDSSTPQSSNRPPFLRWVGTTLAIGLLIYLLSRQGWSEIGGAIRQIAWWRFALALVLVAISRLAVVGRWHVLMRSAGTGITPRQSLEITFAGLFTSNFLPTTIGGDVIRLASAIRLGFDKAISVASLVVDRLVGMAGMAMALPFALPAFLSWKNSSPVTLAPIAIPGIKPLWDRAVRILQRLFEALTLWLHKPRSLLESLGFTWVHMLCTFAQVWLFLGGMGEHISFWLVAGLWSATYFVTLLPISINGIGVQELIMAFLFTRFGGVSQASGLTLALLMRALQMIASLPGALFLPKLVAGDK